MLGSERLTRGRLERGQLSTRARRTAHVSAASWACFHRSQGQHPRGAGGTGGAWDGLQEAGRFSPEPGTGQRLQGDHFLTIKSSFVFCICVLLHNKIGGLKT